MNVGMISARMPATTAARPAASASAPSGRGMPRRSSRVAPADSGIAMITVISTASISVASCRNSRPKHQQHAPQATTAL